LVKRLAGGAWVHGSDAVDGEQRLLTAGRALLWTSLELLGEQRCDPWSVWNEAALAELPAFDDEQVAGGIDVADPQSARLAGAEPEPVAEPEDRLMSRAPARRSQVVSKRAGGVQAAGLAPDRIERDPVRGCPPPSGLQR
jgi:hypothetical protein